MFTLEDLSRSPNALAVDYQHSHVDKRVMLTGHSHQSSPDCSLKGQNEAWMWAANHVEARWDEALEKTWAVREGFGELIHCPPERIALASSVHDLVVRFLSVLPLTKRPKLITTDGEHPSINRQLYRIMEQGVEVVTVAMDPAATVVERVAAQIDDSTAAVFISSVFFETGHVAVELDTLVPCCEKYGCQLFVDAYQSVNVLSFSVRDYNLERAFIVGGGTKYCQLGDGVAFMHVPEGFKGRPLVAGWFGTFDTLEDNPASFPIAYGDDHQLFDGSSYDPTSHYRAVHVFDYFRSKKLTPEFLHDVNHHQLHLLEREFRTFDFDPGVIKLTNDVEYLGGFISLETKHARKLSEMLRDVGIHTDWRKNWLRMGPAPYQSDEQLLDGIAGLEEMVRRLM